MALSSGDTISVRAGKEQDCDVIMDLIKDLAVYEGMLDQVKITAEGAYYSLYNVSCLLYQLNKKKYRL